MAYASTRKYKGAAPPGIHSKSDSLDMLANALEADRVTGLSEIAFTPNPGPQQAFIDSTAFEVLYGGAAGGGKSAGLVALAAEDMDNPAHHAALLRRSNPQLTGAGGLVDKAREFYSRSRWTWRAGAMRWINYASGATVDFRHLANPKALEDYVGQEFTFLGIDELTFFTEHEYKILMSRLRSPAGVIPRIRATTNPGGPGHEWVKRRFLCWLDANYSSEFVDDDGVTHTFGPAESGEVRHFATIGDVDTQVPEWYEDAQSRTYISAKVSDNPYLMRDREYVKKLKNLPELERKRLLEGDWGVYQEGGVFTFNMFRTVLEHELPKGMQWWRGFDLAGTANTRSDNSAWVECSTDKKGNIYIRMCFAAKLDWPKQRRQFKNIIMSPSRGGKNVYNAIEATSNGLPLYQEFSQDPDLNAYTVMPYNPGQGDKISRKQPMAIKGGQGKVFMVEGEWNDSFVQEAVLFGNDGVHDDRIDAWEVAYMMSSQGMATVRKY